MNHYRNKGELNKHQISGIITCIPKGGKMRNDLKNWRPITLLYSICKFYSEILAERIKQLLPKLIHVDQKGFINGRFIGENTRLTYDIINECESQNLKGLIILINFEKAFDSISWKFILNSLKKFNFGESIVSYGKLITNKLKFKNTTKWVSFWRNILGQGVQAGGSYIPLSFCFSSRIFS